MAAITFDRPQLGKIDMLPEMNVQSLSNMAQLHKNGGSMSSSRHWWKLCDRRGHYDGYSFTGCSDVREAKDFLRRCSYAFSGDEDHTRLAYLFTRAQRGMISYYRRPVADLRKFCTARGYSFGKGLKKEKFVLMLERADEDAKFPRFLELPPELREMVYGYSFEVSLRSDGKEWRESPYHLAAPPVASVSRLVRKESLPLFYAGGTLDIDMVATLREETYRYSEPHSTTDFFAEAPKVVLESVRQVDIPVNILEGDPIMFTILLPQEKAPYKISVQGTKAELRSSAVKFADKGLRKVLDDMAVRAAGRRVKLERGDIYTIRRVFQEMLNYRS